jgi:hypothetical protein
VPLLDKSEIRLNMIPKTGPTAQNLSVDARRWRLQGRSDTTSE